MYNLIGRAVRDPRAYGGERSERQAREACRPVMSERSERSFNPLRLSLLGPAQPEEEASGFLYYYLEGLSLPATFYGTTRFFN